MSFPLSEEQEKKLRALNTAFLAENAKINLSAFRTEEQSWFGNIMDSIAAMDLPFFSSIPRPLPPKEEGELRDEYYKKKPVPGNTLFFAREMRKNPTEAEEALWILLRNDQLGVRFRRQAPFGGFIFDFFCPSLKFAIEVDGEIHRQSEKADQERDTYFLEEFHIHTLRFSNDEVLSAPNRVMTEIKNYIQKHSPPPLEEGLGVEETKKIIDVGTGGGFPLLPLAILLPETTCTGLDSTQKKISAVERIAEEMSLTNVHCLAARAEELGHDPAHREQYDIVLSRAVAEIPTLLEFCAPFVKVGGYVVFWKSVTIDKELQDSLMARAEFSCQLTLQHRYTLGETWGDRQLIVFQKRAPLAKKYPREVGVPKKKPLL
jgi:16S rRNA (guanine527-N7)-methyltransferase